MFAEIPAVSSDAMANRHELKSKIEGVDSLGSSVYQMPTRSVGETDQAEDHKSIVQPPISSQNPANIDP